MTRIDPKRLPGLCRERAKGYGALRPNSLTAIALDAAADRIEALEAALKPFADCAEQIADDESDEEWAKFRLLIKNYRDAKVALDAR